MHPDRHLFGSYCLFKIPKELRAGKWQPSSEKGIWVGNSGDVNHGHLVVPIEWDSAAWGRCQNTLTRVVKPAPGGFR